MVLQDQWYWCDAAFHSEYKYVTRFTSPLPFGRIWTKAMVNTFVAKCLNVRASLDDVLVYCESQAYNQLLAINRTLLNHA